VQIITVIQSLLAENKIIQLFDWLTFCMEIGTIIQKVLRLVENDDIIIRIFVTAQRVSHGVEQLVYH
jgi:hypothetical protein